MKIGKGVDNKGSVNLRNGFVNFFNNSFCFHAAFGKLGGKNNHKTDTGRKITAINNKNAVKIFAGHTAVIIH